MDCIIKVISGPDAGQEFRCTAQETVVGRSARCAVRLTSPSVSFEHAVISRAGDDFLIENLSANGTFLNNERVTAKTRLRAKDQIRIGDETVARVESVPTAAGGGSARRTLLVIVALLMLALLAAVVIDPFSAKNNLDWSGAYQRLQDWTQLEAAAGRLPAETAPLLREASRQEQAKDRPAALKAWVRLQVLLSGAKNAAGDPLQANRRALSKLTAPDKSAPLADDEMAGALVQFVNEMERRK